jgi:hypothetical protein
LCSPKTFLLSSVISMWSQSFSLSCQLTAKAQTPTSTVCYITSSLRSTTSSTTSTTMVPRSVKIRKIVSSWSDKEVKIRETRLDFQPRLMENPRIRCWLVKCQTLARSPPSSMKTMHHLLLETNLRKPKAKEPKTGAGSQPDEWEPKPPEMIV